MRAVAALFALLLFAACSSSISGFSPKPQPLPSASGASIALGINDGNKPGYHLALSVGGGPTRPFLLDTGSSGFWVYPNAIGTYRATTIKVKNDYGSGLHYDGVLVYTTVDFGNGIKTGQTQVALVKKADCKKGGRTCPADPGSKYCPSVKPGKDAGILCLEAGRKLYGTFGGALATIPAPSSSPTDELTNPIFAIAQPWASAFEVTPGALVVGRQPLAGFVTMKLSPQHGVPKPLTNGAKAWNRDVTLCYTLGSLHHRCFASLFDTGASNVDFQANVTLPLSNSSCGPRVRPGTKVLVQNQDGSNVEVFDAGSKTNWNRVVVSSPKSKGPQVNTGMTFFNRDAIYYDAAAGVVGIAPLATPANVATTGCGSD